MSLVKTLRQIRRTLLKRLVPEFVWPKAARIDGVDIRVRGAPYSFGVKRVLTSGNYEPEERELIARFIQPGMQIVEMGGSIGIVASVISDRIGPEGRLVTVEASDTLTAHSSTWLGKLPQTTVLTGFAFPVWRLRPGFAVAGFDDGNGSLGGRVQIGGESGPSLDRERIWDLGRICDDHKLEPDALICDIEGSEAVLLDHDLDWPASIKNVVIELHPFLLANGRDDIESICRRIEQEGFELREGLGDTFWFSRTGG